MENELLKDEVVESETAALETEETTFQMMRTPLSRATLQMMTITKPQIWRKLSE